MKLENISEREIHLISNGGDITCIIGHRNKGVPSNETYKESMFFYSPVPSTEAPDSFIRDAAGKGEAKYV